MQLHFEPWASFLTLSRWPTTRAQDSNPTANQNSSNPAHPPGPGHVRYTNFVTLFWKRHWRKGRGPREPGRHTVGAYFDLNETGPRPPAISIRDPLGESRVGSPAPPLHPARPPARALALSSPALPNASLPWLQSHGARYRHSHHHYHCHCNAPAAMAMRPLSRKPAPKAVAEMRVCSARQGSIWRGDDPEQSKGWLKEASRRLQWRRAGKVSLRWQGKEGRARECGTGSRGEEEEWWYF